MRWRFDEDWRLTFVCEAAAEPERLLAELRSLVEHRLVLTHDARDFFAYAKSEKSIGRARSDIERVIGHTPIVVSHWESERGFWRQIHPAIADEEATAQWEATAREGEAQRQAIAALRRTAGPSQAEDRITRSVACVVGRVVRKQFEAEIASSAQYLELELEIAERRHLLSTHVTFNVTGALRSVQAFERYVRDKAPTMKLDPGLIPWG